MLLLLIIFSSFSSDFQRLTLDPNTAHRALSLSDNNREVTNTLRQVQSYPDHPDRFDGEPQVLCAEAQTGRCYCEAECSGPVDIGVTYRGISRKGRGDDCRLGDNNMSWSLYCDPEEGYFVRHNREVTELPVWPSDDYRVSVYVDCPAGTLSFYDVSSDSLRHLHTFHNNTFTEPLYVGFRLWSIYSSPVRLCDQR